MTEGSDYAKQTSAVNAIDDSPISEAMRLICYNQTIYNDVRLELNEYMGLTLGVSLTRVLTFVQLTYDEASILIVDNDSKFYVTGAF